MTPTGAWRRPALLLSTTVLLLSAALVQAPSASANSWYNWGKMYSQAHPGWGCLDTLPGGTYAQFVQVWVTGCENKDTQQWAWDIDTHQIMGSQNYIGYGGEQAGRDCLGVYGGDTGNGSRVYLLPCGVGYWEHWKPIGPNGAYLQLEEDPSQCLDDPGGQYSAGLQTWECNTGGNANQMWLVVGNTGG